MQSGEAKTVEADPIAWQAVPDADSDPWWTLLRRATWALRYPGVTRLQCKIFIYLRVKSSALPAECDVEKGEKKKQKRENGGGRWGSWGPGGKVTKGTRELNHAVLVRDQAVIAFMTITHEPKLTHQHPNRGEQGLGKEKRKRKKTKKEKKISRNQVKDANLPQRDYWQVRQLWHLHW